MYCNRRAIIFLSHRVRLKPMRIEANTAPVAALFAEPSRAAILSVLLDGRALPAGGTGESGRRESDRRKRAFNKTHRRGLLAVEVEARHRYYRLANAGVAHVMEDLALLTKEPAIFSHAAAFSCRSSAPSCRSCYDHLAGELAVAIA